MIIPGKNTTSISKPPNIITGLTDESFYLVSTYHEKLYNTASSLYRYHLFCVDKDYL